MISYEQKRQIDLKGCGDVNFGRLMYSAGETMHSSEAKRKGLVKMTKGLMLQNGGRGQTKLVDESCTESR